MMTETNLLEPMLERVLSGETLAEAERHVLLEARDLLALGMAADELRRRRHGSQYTFVRVADLPLERVVAGDLEWQGAPGELRLTGTPRDLSDVVAAVKALVSAGEGRLPVTALSLADIERTVDGDPDRARDWLARLRDAGLAAVAEAPIDRLRSAEAMVEAAERADLAIARLTVERLAHADRDAVLAHARRLCAAFPSLQCFAPLPRRTSGVTPSTGYEDVHLVALARLLVDVEHIQVDWSLYGPKLAQVALGFGADDVDGVSPLEEVAEGRRRAPLEEIRRNITAASGTPLERDARFAARQ